MVLVCFLLEEICTLVIAEAFPEDGGLFCCTASNPFGSINSTAHLAVTAGACNTDRGVQRVVTRQHRQAADTTAECCSVTC